MAEWGDTLVLDGEGGADRESAELTRPATIAGPSHDGAVTASRSGGSNADRPGVVEPGQHPEPREAEARRPEPWRPALDQPAVARPRSEGAKAGPAAPLGGAQEAEPAVSPTMDAAAYAIPDRQAPSRARSSVSRSVAPPAAQSAPSVTSSEALEPASFRKSGSAAGRPVASAPGRPDDMGSERQEHAARTRPVERDAVPTAVQLLTYLEPGNARPLDHQAGGAERTVTGSRAMTVDRLLEVPPVDGGVAPPRVAPLTVEVSIDRIEVRATPPPATQRGEPRRPPGLMTLDEYLRRRTRGGSP